MPTNRLQVIVAWGAGAITATFRCFGAARLTGVGSKTVLHKFPPRADSRLAAGERMIVLAPRPVAAMASVRTSRRTGRR